MANETPTILNASYGSSTSIGDTWATTTTGMAVADTWTFNDSQNLLLTPHPHQDYRINTLRAKPFDPRPIGRFDLDALQIDQESQADEGEIEVGRRFVQVFIMDNNESVPIEDAMLYKGEPALTDATNEELFFDIDISGVLKKHNEKRITLYKKGKAHKAENKLDAARIRDLSMVVVDIAAF